MRRPLESDARHLVVVVEALGEVFGLADVDGTMLSRRGLLREDVVPWHGLEVRAEGVDAVLVLAAGEAGPVDCPRCGCSGHGELPSVGAMYGACAERYAELVRGVIDANKVRSTEVIWTNFRNASIFRAVTLNDGASHGGNTP